MTEPSERTPLTIWVGRELRDELAAARSLLSHAVPSGKTEDLLLYVLRRVRTLHERKKYGGKRNPKPTAATQPASAAGPPPFHARYASARVRRTTDQREGRSCAFVGAEGRRCGSTWQLEFQHIEPAARGGQPTAANTTLFCRLHNRLQAERDFGKQHVADRIAEAQARRSAPPAVPAAPSSPYVPDAVSALVHLGFKRKQAEEAVRLAVATVPPDCDIQTLLREALRILVPSRSAAS